MYEAVLDNVKTQSEKDLNTLKQIHDQFDFIYDKDRMKDRTSTRWFDPQKLDEMEELQMSTEFTDEEEQQVYRRYRMETQDKKHTLEEYNDVIEEL